MNELLFHRVTIFIAVEARCDRRMNCNDDRGDKNISLTCVHKKRLDCCLQQNGLSCFINISDLDILVQCILLAFSSEVEPR